MQKGYAKKLCAVLASATAMMLFAGLNDLKAGRVSPDVTMTKARPIKIDIGQGEEYVAFEGVPMRFDRLDENIKKLASVSTETPIFIRVTQDSLHGTLVRVLDICYKYKMYRLAVLSM